MRKSMFKLLGLVAMANSIQGILAMANPNECALGTLLRLVEFH